MTSGDSVDEANHFEIQRRPTLREFDIVRHQTSNKDVG